MIIFHTDANKKNRERERERERERPLGLHKTTAMGINVPLQDGEAMG